MSQENGETLRQSFVAFDQRNRAAWLASRAQDVEVLAARYWPEAGAVRGREAAWDFYVQAVEPFDGFSAADAELVEAGPDKVLIHQRHALRGRASGAEVELNYWVVVTFQEGRIVSEHWFADRDEALEAAGLRE
jgi:ketosteroid isomerase-like protein